MWAGYFCLVLLTSLRNMYITKYKTIDNRDYVYIRIYSGLETEVCDITNPVHFQWEALGQLVGYPYYSLQSKCPSAPIETKHCKSEVTYPIVL